MLFRSGGGNGIDDDPYAGVLGDVPAEILELSENCRQYALSAVGVELDYEVETLPILDEYLRVAAAGLKDRPEAAPVVTGTVAAYFGEVVRRRIDGFWRHLDDPNGALATSASPKPVTGPARAISRRGCASRVRRDDRCSGADW